MFWWWKTKSSFETSSNVFSIEAGFDVLVVEPAEALPTMNQRGATVRALVTDIRLGSGISSWDIATHARKLHPQMAIVYMSGDLAAEWPVHGVPDSPMLQKPFASAQVIAAVSELLNSTLP